jgi:N-acetylgalactosamine-N,N'-diacetylbacillosaminyl-diphospho-undecaprenol 4-alpha-N-acetylgalactosaminyltransferase
MGPGGAERVVSILLPELVKRYEVTLILMNETLFHPVPDEVEIVWLERSRPDENGTLKLLKLPFLAWRLERLRRKHGIGRIVSLMNRPNYIAALAKLAGGDFGLALCERGTPSYQYAGNSLQARINRWLIRRLYPVADIVTANTEGAAKDLAENFGVPATKLEVVSNPFDLATIEKDCARGSAKKNGDFVFVTVGRLDEGKNHSLLIEAFARIRRPGMKLRIVGEGPLRNELQRQIVALGLENDVTLEGAKRNPFAILASSDAFVFASRHEGFPNVLVEALACALPVISTDCPSGPGEILAPGADHVIPDRGFLCAPFGLLVPVDDRIAMQNAMKEVYNNGLLRSELVSAAPGRAADFAKERQIGKLLSLIERLPQ